MEMEPPSHWNCARAALLGLASFHCFLSLLNHWLLFCDFFMLTALLFSPHLPPPPARTSGVGSLCAQKAFHY